jgi:hypothetical protein
MEEECPGQTNTHPVPTTNQRVSPALNARSAASLSDFRDRFSRRLLGIAASHDVLIRQNWEGAPLADLIRQHVDPFDGAAESRLLLDGPNVSVSPSAAQALGLALHELATNSVKYGATSITDPLAGARRASRLASDSQGLRTCRHRTHGGTFS